MRLLRLLIAVLGCFAGAGAILWRLYTQPVPSRSDLDVVEGIVSQVSEGSRSSRSATVHFPVVRVAGREEQFRYLDWFPDPHRIYTEVRPGDHVRILSDSKRNVWIWELTKGDQPVVRYDVIAEAVRSNNRFDPYFAIGLTAIGTWGIFRLKKFTKRKGGEPGATDNPDAAQRLREDY